MTGFRDPKPGSNSWAIGEKLTQEQLTKILGNQRTFAQWPFVNMEHREPIGAAITGTEPKDILFTYSVQELKSAWFTWSDNSVNDIATVTDLEGSWASGGAALSPAGTIRPSKGAAKNNPATTFPYLWIGVTRSSSTSEGYLHRTGGTWSIVNRAAAGTGNDDVTGMWYWPEKDTFIASWRYASNAHRFEYNVAGAGWVDTSNGLTGDYEIHNADMSPTDFVAVGQNPSGTTLTSISHSINGTSFSPVTVANKDWRCVAYDRTEGIWYLLASDWTLYTSTDPASGFSNESSFAAPNAAITLLNSNIQPPKMVVQGGVMAIGPIGQATAGFGAVWVTSDLGATWVRVTDHQGTNTPILKILDGRLVTITGRGTTQDIPMVGHRGLEPPTVSI